MEDIADRNTFGRDVERAVYRLHYLAKRIPRHRIRIAHERVETASEHLVHERAVVAPDDRVKLVDRVDDIAGFVGLSRSQLFRLFRDNLNTSPKQYLENYRAQRACLLLKETDLPIRVISASVGIEDATYFSKLFKKAVGVSPIRYREEQTKTQEPS